jgi:L-lactate dehydrogenase complex protein LldG
MDAEREQILMLVRRALAPMRERAAMPRYDTQMAVPPGVALTTDRVALFTERIERVNGQLLTEPAALVAYLRQHRCLRGYCDPGLWPELAPYFGEDFTVELEFDRSRVDDYAFGITRAAGAIAESGTIILNVAVVDRSAIHLDVPSAIAALGSDRNVIWCTGPSKTADVEGILIEGVHGPGVQIALVR